MRTARSSSRAVRRAPRHDRERPFDPVAEGAARARRAHEAGPVEEGREQASEARGCRDGRREGVDAVGDEPVDDHTLGLRVVAPHSHAEGGAADCDAAAGVLGVRLRQITPGGGDARAHPHDRRQVTGLGADLLGDRRVARVIEQHGFLTREVAEEGHLGHPSGRGNLADRDGVVTALLEEVHRGAFETLPGALRRGHGQNVSN